MFATLPKKIKFTKEKLAHLSLAGVLLFGLIEPVIFPPKANAVAASGYVRPDRLATSATGTATSGGLVCTTAQGAGVEAKVLITFPGNGTVGAASFGLSSTPGNWTLGTTNIPSGTTAWPGIGANPSSVAGAVMTVASSDLTPGTTYCFTFVGATTLSNPTSTGSGSTFTGTIVTQTAGSSPIDTVNWATAIISNDQIAVNATVPSTFTFALVGNSQSLSLTTSGVAAGTGSTATINTNANNGWILWVKSLNGALNSAGTGDSISSPGTSNATPEDLLAQSGYVLDSDLTTDAGSGGTVTIDPEFNYTGTVDATHGGGGHLTTAFQSVASANGPAAGDVITLITRGKAGSLNKAANDYSDTLTVTAAGQF